MDTHPLTSFATPAFGNWHSCTQTASSRAPGPLQAVADATRQDAQQLRVDDTGAAPTENKLPRVLIAGAGIGGLVLAVALLKRGFQVQIFERDLTAIRGEGKYRGPIQVCSRPPPSTGGSLSSARARWHGKLTSLTGLAGATIRLIQSMGCSTCAATPPLSRVRCLPISPYGSDACEALHNLGTPAKVHQDATPKSCSMLDARNCRSRCAPAHAGLAQRACRCNTSTLTPPSIRSCFADADACMPTPLQVQSNALAALEAIDMDMAEEVLASGCITGDRVNGLCDGVTGDW